MNIYIDESGIFKPMSAKVNPWYVTGGFHFKENSEKFIISALNQLKKSNNFEDLHSEIKISDIYNHNAVVDFIEVLRSIGCFFCASVMYLDEANKKFFLRLMETDELNFKEGVFASENRIQLYIQLVSVLECINSSLWSANAYYSKNRPSELKNIGWIIDRKELIDDLTIKLVAKYLSGEGHRFTYGTVKGANKLAHYHKSKDGEKAGFVLNEVASSISYVDSNEVIGVQVVDILAGTLRRCLKGYWNGHAEYVARSLGGLMLDQRPWLRIYNKSSNEEKFVVPLSNKYGFSDAFGFKIFDILKNYSRKIKV